jgi:leucyl aminopeptidase
VIALSDVAVMSNDDELADEITAAGLRAEDRISVPMPRNTRTSSRATSRISPTRRARGSRHHGSLLSSKFVDGLR